jgi:RNA polymerase-binding transcription factor DksA
MPRAAPVTITRRASKVPGVPDVPTASILASAYAACPMEREDARQHLEAERERLEHLRAGFEAEHLHDESEDESLSELSHLAQHQADIASETFEREKDFSILEQVEAELADVERALARLDDGGYGLCEACHCAIGDERLAALPAARFCVEHQAAAESLS